MIINSEVPNPNQKESDANQGVGNKHRGQFSIASKFQTSLDIAANLVKQHSFVVQIRRRTNTGSSASVSIGKIRQHLLDKVPGLKQHEISFPTISRLFQAPNRGNIASHKY